MRFMLAVAFLVAAMMPAHAGITRQAWGDRKGAGVDLYILTNAKGMEARISNYGGIITSITAPDRTGKMVNVVQGFDTLEAYTAPSYSGRYGAIIGRYANRIKNGTFQIGPLTYKVGRDQGYNYKNNHVPYDEQVWQARVSDGEEPQLILSLLDRSGTMGFPGTVRVTATYTLTRDNVLRLTFHAVTDNPTVISLTNHAYFNMAGHDSGSVLDQLLTVNGDAITVGDESNTPTGEIRPVAGTAFDFRKPTPIGAHINDPDPALVRAKGFDQNYVLNGTPGTLRLAARLEDPKSGRVLEEWTTQPGLQVYSANYPPPLAGLANGYQPRGAVALEAQAFPNAPNIASFPSTLLVQNQVYRQTIEFRFSAK